jgi:membrane-bound ClpP family serine protease
MAQLPRSYVTALALVALVILFVVLAAFGVIPLESLFLFLLGNIFLLVTIIVLAFLGGMLIGLFVAHRILQGRGFTPFEKSMLEAHRDIKDLIARVEEAESEIKVRLAALEKKISP